MTKRSSLLILAALFAYSSATYAASAPNHKKAATKTKRSAQSLPSKQNSKPTIFQPANRYRMSAEELKAENERRSKIVRHTEQMFTLLSAEMALNNGDIATAMSLYLNQLRATRDPNVAERAMELAINARAYQIAELVYQQWQEIEPTPSPALQRLEWVRALALGDNATVLANLNTVLQEANEEQRQRAFLILAQMSVVRDDLPQEGKDILYQAAQTYRDLPEAAMADIFFGLANQDDKHTLNALARLAQLDTDINPTTALTLQTLVQNRPDLLTQFFQKTNSKKLSNTWRELEIDGLVNAQQYDLAKEKLNALLGDAPNARLYLQAARLAIRQQSDADTVVAYLDKAYRGGTQEIKSPAAFTAAMYLAEEKRFDEAEKWAAQIDSPDYAFDKAALLVNLAGEQKNWRKAYDLAKTAQALPEQRGLFFSSDDVNNVYLYALTQVLPKAQVLPELNRKLQQAERDISNPDREKIMSQVLFQRGLWYADHLHQSDKAIADFRRYVAINPDNAAGQNALGYTLLTHDDKHINEAFHLISTAYQQLPDNPAINDSMGWAYYKQGDAQMALPYLEFAYREDPTAEGAAHYGAALYRTGNEEKARQLWQQWWQQEPDSIVLKQILNEFGVVFE